jgi:hypothetical protein
MLREFGSTRVTGIPSRDTVRDSRATSANNTEDYFISTIP